jgi:hypothetical protein
LPVRKKSAEQRFQASLKGIRKAFPQDTKLGIVLDMLSQTQKDENRSVLMDALVNLLKGDPNRRLMPAPLTPSGHSRFVINPDDALMPDVSTKSIEDIFDVPGIRRYISPEDAESLDPRARSTRDYMAIDPDEAMSEAMRLFFQGDVDMERI